MSKSDQVCSFFDCRNEVARHSFAANLGIEQNAISIEVDHAVCTIRDIVDRRNGRRAHMIHAFDTGPR